MKRFLLAMAVVGVLAGAAAPTSALSGPPYPTVLVPPPVPAGATEVFGETSAGEIFFNRPGADPRGAVRHEDGSVTALGKTLSGRGEMGPDGRLWLPINGSLWAFAGDGTGTEYPIDVPGGITTTGLNEVRSGVDGKIWFTDTLRSRVGSVDPDGTSAVVYPLAGERGLEHLARGNDGRMWVSRSIGTLHAVTPTGTVTTYPSIGKPVAGLASNPSGLYASVAGTLVRISDAGVASPVPLPVVSYVDAMPVASGGWIWIGAATVISPSGRIAQFAMPVEYTLQDLQNTIDLAVYPDNVTVAASQVDGFVATVGPRLVRIPNPDVSVNLKVKATIIESKGANVLHVVASARTPGGSPVSGGYEVRINWNRYIPEGFTFIEKQSRLAGRVQVGNGTGTVDIPITPALTAGTPVPYTLDHGQCCTVSLRAATGLNSVAIHPTSQVPGDLGAFQPSSTMRWLDRMNRQALARGMDANGIVYWAGRLGAGTPRSTVTRSIVDSTAWRRQRVTATYKRWLGRTPDAAGLEYWQQWLPSHTSSDLDFQIGTTAAARDAGGTTNAQRGKHLASALRLSSTSATSFQQQLDRGASWGTLVRSAYFSRSASERRMTDLAPRSSFTPSLAALVAEFQRTRDERGPLVKALATMP